jgi:phosphoribosylformylglycinamidine cyclo-ligase
MASLVRTLRQAGQLPHGMAHITGGGLPENLPRCLPPGVHGVIDSKSWERPAVFRWLQERGGIPEADLWHTFNLGVGFCLVVGGETVEPVLAICREQGHRAWKLGTVAKGDHKKGSIAGIPS